MPENFSKGYFKVLALIVFLTLCSFVLFGLQGSIAQESNSEVIETKVSYDQMVLPVKPAVIEPQDIIFNEEKIIEISRNLRNAIEENKDLLNEKKEILDELKQLRGQHEVDVTKVTAITQERDALSRQLEELQKDSNEQLQKTQALQSTLDQKTQEWEVKLKKIQDQLALQEKLNEDMASLKGPPSAQEDAIPDANSLDVEGVQQVIAKVEALNEENDDLRTESAKVHYNMGNIFFKQGDYPKAAVEYTQAVELVPYDPANHYNLAFVSGEFLDDPQTALTHYQQYLFLNPNAKDINFVKERILKAKMALQSMIDSPLEKPSNRINDPSF